jgi:hypothetical protein
VDRPTSSHLRAKIITRQHVSMVPAEACTGQHGPVDKQQVHVLRDLLSSSGWVERTRDFAGSLRRSTSQPGGLLLVGTPQEEPWHLAAHLDDEARFSGVPGLTPTLVRYAPPPGAPPHLAVGLERLQAVSRGETLFIVAPDAAPEQLLERVADAKRIGATILSIDNGDDDLASLAHDRLVVPSYQLDVPTNLDMNLASVDFETVQHLVSVAAGEADQRSKMRDRLSKLLERVSGPAPRR